jgi:hypothetical protein
MTTSFIELNYVRKRELSGEEIAMLDPEKEADHEKAHQRKVTVTAESDYRIEN